MTGVSQIKNRRHPINRKKTLDEQLWKHQRCGEGKKKEQKWKRCSRLMGQKEMGQTSDYWLAPHLAKEGRKPWNTLFGGAQTGSELLIWHLLIPFQTSSEYKELGLRTASSLRPCAAGAEDTEKVPGPRGKQLTLLGHTGQSKPSSICEEDWDWPVRHSHSR